MGYQVQYIYEVWHFEETCEGLFADYVNTWLKIKQEASGWPKDDMTEQQKQLYIEQYFLHEGIQLEYDNIKKNPGLRTLAKLMLNSMWGKFGQRLNKTPNSKPFMIHRSFIDSWIVMSWTFVTSPSSMTIWWRCTTKIKKRTSAFHPTSTFLWPASPPAMLGSNSTTALEALGERVLYLDTDSVIYLEETPAQFKPTLGSYLGDFTSEIDHDEYIQEFVSGGPKNYGYATNKGKVECKVRGFRLNSEGHAQLNYDVMRQNVLDEIKKPLLKPRQTQIIKTHQIVRDPKHYLLYTFPEYKQYQLVFDKRVVDPVTFQTYPYGYQ